jgi:WASH complex subunit 7
MMISDDDDEFSFLRKEMVMMMVILKTNYLLFEQPQIKDEHIEDIKNTLRMLDILCNIEKIFSEACNCSFFYWSRVLVNPYFSDIWNHPDQAQKLQYMFAAFRDIVPLFNTVVHLDPKEFITIYDKEITQSLENNLILPVCRAIEEDLRFHIHTHLEVSIFDL